MSFLPAGFVHPRREDLTSGHHLRPIREDDVAIDYPAVMGSQERLWTIFGEAWGWPQPTMSYAKDQADLARHEREANAHESFNYAVLDRDESMLFGCVYIDPAERVGADADICWWVIDDAVDSPLDGALTEFVPQWIHAVWPFTSPRIIGVDLTWPDWLALPPV